MQTENMNSVKAQIIRQANVNVVYEKDGRLIAQVIKKLPLSELKDKDIVPRYAGGLRTNVIEKGEINYYNSKKYLPVFGGISCIESNKGAGTLGVIVRDITTGNLVGLTCNHCVGTLFDINYDWPAYGNTALSHIEMLQPSYNDGGRIANGDSLGAPVRAIATQFGTNGNNIVDAGIIEIPSNMAKTDIQNIYIGPFQFIEDKVSYGINETVWKNGRTTNLTTALIDSVSTNVMVSTGNDDAYYNNQIMLDATSYPIQPGDSGAVILTKSQGIWKIIGLLFAGNATGDQVFVNHIVDVASLLQIEAWDGNISIADSSSDYILVNGRCYKYTGTTLRSISHITQRSYSVCANCKADSYPNKKVHMVT
jgi:hypothetical protein